MIIQTTEDHKGIVDYTILNQAFNGEIKVTLDGEVMKIL